MEKHMNNNNNKKQYTHRKSTNSGHFYAVNAERFILNQTFNCYIDLLPSEVPNALQMKQYFTVNGMQINTFCGSTVISIIS